MKCVFVDEGHIKVRWLLALARRDENLAAEIINSLPHDFPDFQQVQDLVAALGIRPTAFSNWFAEPTERQGAKINMLFNRPRVQVARDIARLFGFASPADDKVAWRAWWNDRWRSFMPSENDHVNRREKAPAEIFKQQYCEALKNGELIFPQPAVSKAQAATETATSQLEELPQIVSTPAVDFEPPLQTSAGLQENSNSGDQAAAGVSATLLRTYCNKILRNLSENGPTIIGGFEIVLGIAHLINSEPEKLLLQSVWEYRWGYADLLFGISGILIGLGCIGEIWWARKAGICYCTAGLVSAVFWFADEGNWDPDIVRVTWVANLLNPPVCVAVLFYFLAGWPDQSDRRNYS